MISWLDITRFGDLTITAFAAVAIAAWLLAEGEKQLAFWWSLLFTLGMGIVVATKVAFMGWGIGIRAIDFAGFSGHAMRASAVLPVLFYLMLKRTPRAVRASGAYLGLAFGALVAVSRVVLHAHSISESVAGWLLGATVSVGFILIAGAGLRAKIHLPLRLALGLLVLAPAPYVHPAPTQQWLSRFTMLVTGHDQLYLRGAWKEGWRESGAGPES